MIKEWEIQDDQTRYQLLKCASKNFQGKKVLFVMSITATYAEYYARGPMRDVRQTHRRVGALGQSIFRVDQQPIGMIKAPEMRCGTIQLAVAGTGNARLNLGAGRFDGRARPGHWIVTPPKQACQYDLDTSLSLIMLEIPSTESEDGGTISGDFGRLHSMFSDDTTIAGLIGSIWEDSINDNPLGPLWTDQALATLLGLMHCLASKTPFTTLERGGLAPWQVRRAVEHLNDLLDKDVKLDRLASDVGLSAFHFSRAFKKSVGASPFQYKTQRRVARTRELLKDTSLPITEIAFLVGYESPQALARVFTRETGKSPSVWRRESQS